jgi:hypothetical protein
MRSSSRVTEVAAYVVSLLLGVVFVMLWLHVVDSPPTFAHWTGAFPVIAGIVVSDLWQRRRRSRNERER